MNKEWLREVIANNDRMTAVEFILNRHKKIIRNLKQDKKKKTWDKDKYPRVVIDEFIKAEDK